jgi:hypothetical protein
MTSAAVVVWTVVWALNACLNALAELGLPARWLALVLVLWGSWSVTSKSSSEALTLTLAQMG